MGGRLLKPAEFTKLDNTGFTKWWVRIFGPYCIPFWAISVFRTKTASNPCVGAQAWI